MSINPLSAVTSSMAATSGRSTALDRDAFLKLLITQIANQDPLSPTDDTEFIAQLAQFSGLEAMVDVRDSVDGLSLMQTAATNAQVASFVGRQVTARSDSFEIGDGDTPELGIRLASRSEETTVKIFDDTGKLVKTLELGGQDAGNQMIGFDGLDSHGQPLPPGEYTFTVEATDSAGEDIDALGLLRARVNGISFEKGYAELLLGSTRIALGDIVEVST